MKTPAKPFRQSVEQPVVIDKAVDALVANRVLFPKKIEKARQILKKG
jgi:stalled ribosome alternative rescue factor ArfA